MEVCKFIEGSFIPSFDGASERFSQISKNLAKLDANLTVVHCYRGWSDLKTIAQQGFQTYAISPRYFYQDHSLAERIVIERKPDIVEMDSMEQILTCGLYLNRRFRVPVVYDAQFVSSVLMNDLNADKKAIEDKRRLERALAGTISGAICFTDLDKLNLVNSSGIEPERVKVIPLGSDVNTIRLRELQDTDCTVLFLGNMYFEPNSEAVEYTVENIIPGVLEQNPGVIFKFVGDVPLSLKERYENEYTIFPGRILDINEVFEGTRACIAPILIGGGMKAKILAYMASGVPVVATSIGSEGVSDRASLRIGDSVKEFTAQINELLNNMSGSIDLGKRARELVESNYSWESIARRCIDFYQELVTNPKVSHMKPVQILTEPFWLTETIQKGRFKRQAIDAETMYLLGFGRSEEVSVKDFVNQ